LSAATSAPSKNPRPSTQAALNAKTPKVSSISAMPDFPRTALRRAERGSCLRFPRNYDEAQNLVRTARFLWQALSDKGRLHRVLRYVARTVPHDWGNFRIGRRSLRAGQIRTETGKIAQV